MNESTLKYRNPYTILAYGDTDVLHCFTPVAYSAIRSGVVKCYENQTKTRICVVGHVHWNVSLFDSLSVLSFAYADFVVHGIVFLLDINKSSADPLYLYGGNAYTWKDFLYQDGPLESVFVWTCVITTCLFDLHLLLPLTSLHGTFSVLQVLCEGNPPATGGFLSQKPVTWSFDVFFDLHLNKRLSKQSRSLGRHRNVLEIPRECSTPHRGIYDCCFSLIA